MTRPTTQTLTIMITTTTTKPTPRAFPAPPLRPSEPLLGYRLPNNYVSAGSRLKPPPPHEPLNMDMDLLSPSLPGT
ncbi:hypothetical protein EX30DRAFT_249852 [Ascodesmis nigricans]|uniref:Uncharacterized protein n=1 Tax=Ascodesmis nigricans TaxID=341454 RepID=A0A4V3SIV2_9PEZI|nr:hypothetical protein EX30DRAFT_249852 [Ascodesmis nigricans]